MCSPPVPYNGLNETVVTLPSPNILVTKSIPQKASRAKKHSERHLATELNSRSNKKRFRSNSMSAKWVEINHDHQRPFILLAPFHLPADEKDSRLSQVRRPFTSATRNFFHQPSPPGGSGEVLHGALEVEVLL